MFISRREQSEVSFRTTMTVPGQSPLHYYLQLTPQGTGYAISEESLDQVLDSCPAPFRYIQSKAGDVRYFEPTIGDYVGPAWEYNWVESALSQLTRAYQQPEHVRRILNPITRYHVLDVGRLAPIKLPQQLRPTMMPSENGEDLASFLYNLRESNHYKYEAIEDSLRASFPGLESLRFPDNCSGHGFDDLERTRLQSAVLHARTIGRYAAISLARVFVAESAYARYHDDRRAGS